MAVDRSRGGGNRHGVALTPPPQPLLVVTDWGAAGAAPLGALAAAIAAGFFFYLRALRRRTPFSLPVLLAASAVGLAIAWSSPVLFSSDAYAYAAYGEMARIGLNPYQRAPHDIADVIVAAAQRQWGSAFPICLYGVAFVGFARSVVTIFAPFGFFAQLDAFRVAACLALLACTALAYGAFAGDRATRLRAAATIGLNPVVIWCAVEGHNDALALAVVLAGFGLVARKLVPLGAAIAALSALIKAPGAAAAAGLAVMDRRARIGALAGIAIAAAASIPLFSGSIGDLAPRGHYAPQASVAAVFAPLGLSFALAIAAAIGVALGMQGTALLRRASAEGWIWLGLAAWAIVPNPYPWYAVWIVALAALAPGTRAASVAILLSFTSLLRYVPDALGTPGTPLSIALGVGAALPLVALIPFRRANLYNERLV